MIMFEKLKITDKITFFLLVIAPFFSVLKVWETGFLLQDFFGFIIIILNFKVLLKTNNKYSNLLFFFTLVSMLSMVIIGLEPIRFFWALFLAFVFSKLDFDLLKNSVRYSIYIASVYLFLTIAFLYFFKVNISLDFGSYGLMENTFSGVEEVELTSDLKLGGLFREPNWFSIFAVAGLYTAINQGNSIYYSIVVSAIFLSNSAYGFFIAILSFFFFFKGNLFKIIFIGLVILLFLFVIRDSSFFSRSIDTLNFNNPVESRGSSSIRIIEPWITYYNNKSIFPISYKKNIFPNTGVVFFSVFGYFIAFIFFFMLAIYTRFSFLFIAFFLAVISDGFYSRIEFSILLALLAGTSKIKT